MSPKKILVLHLKTEFYDAIERGCKDVEYRDLTDYWIKRILDKAAELEEVHFFKGYPPRGTIPLVRKIRSIVRNNVTKKIEIYLISGQP